MLTLQFKITKTYMYLYMTLRFLLDHKVRSQTVTISTDFWLIRKSFSFAKHCSSTVSAVQPANFGCLPVTMISEWCSMVHVP